MIKVNVSIQGRRPGDIVKEGDKDFEAFKGWAEREDRKGGAVICHFVEPAKVAHSKAHVPPASETDLSEEVPVVPGEMDRKTIMAKLKEKGISFFPGAKIDVLLAKLKEAGE